MKKKVANPKKWGGVINCIVIILSLLICMSPLIVKGTRWVCRKRIETIRTEIAREFPGVVCWGDSLTAGAGGNGTRYPSVLSEKIAEKYAPISVLNMGVGGEDTKTILARAGKLPIYVTKDFVIPADTETTVEVQFALEDGSKVTPLRQGNGGMNPVTINGITGTLQVQQDDIWDTEVAYFFKRAEAGNEQKVTAGTVIVPQFASEINDKRISVIFIGTNGGYASIAHLMEQQKMLIESEHYLIIGLTRENAEKFAEMDAALEAEFGKRFLNLRKWICENGLERAGLIATDADRTAIEKGQMPPSLMSDGVHFNQHGYQIIGEAVFERLDELGTFDALSQYEGKYDMLTNLINWLNQLYQ